MKFVLILLVGGSVLASAQAPRKDPLTKYRQLWEKSLVTVPPPPPEKEEVVKVTELDDYVLGGWTQTSQGYLVSLINSKNPKERITIAPGMPNKGGYQVVEVKRDPMNYKSSEVLIQMGSDKKWIGYEDKFLTLQQPPAAKNNAAAQQAAKQKPPMPNSNSSNKQATKPTPRVRRVPVPPKK
ncbi:MAG: hypothetical protein ACSHYB_07365 [Roseibacillus sp.]